jgi:hypothetical protein
MKKVIVMRPLDKDVLYSSNFAKLHAPIVNTIVESTAQVMCTIQINEMWDSS